MKKILFVLGLAVLYKPCYALDVKAYQVPAVIVSSVATGANSSVSITLATPTTPSPYSTGYYNYLTHIYTTAFATGTVTATNLPVSCTVTGLPATTFNLDFATGVSANNLGIRDLSFEGHPVQAIQGTKVVITCPATGGILWDLTVTYFQDK